MADKDTIIIEKNPPAMRFTPPQELKVSAKTLGTKLVYDLPVANLSRSGMLLQCANARQTPPFIENTLLEIEFTTTLRGQPRRIACFGKVVRKFSENQNLHYGVRVIHSDENDQVEWMSLITTFEKAIPAKVLDLD
jgi:hypothetical protein